MADYTIVLGNKNYSSWSLRAWLALKRTGAAFEEVVIPLDQPDTQAAIQQWSAAGKVPVLRHGERVVWDSLAIGEYLAETHPEAGLWPADAGARAMARSAVAEMHAGFRALREALPMDVRNRVAARRDDEVGADIARVCALWSQCRASHGDGGPYLFGEFTLADCFYAPVASRFVTYGVELPHEARAYVEAVTAHPAMQAWSAAAAAEPWVIANP